MSIIFTSRPVLGALISTIGIGILLSVSTIDIGHSLYDIVLTLRCTPYPAPPMDLPSKQPSASPNQRWKTLRVEPSFTATKWVLMLSLLRPHYAFAPTIRAGAVYCRHQ